MDMPHLDRRMAAYFSFREWLAHRYGSLDNLNATMALAFAR
jgi:uncharacterized protein YutE (UPF0331/DUF86 family)